MNKRDPHPNKKFNRFQKRLFETESDESSESMEVLEHPTLMPATVVQLLSPDEIYDNASQELLESLSSTVRSSTLAQPMNSQTLTTPFAIAVFRPAIASDSRYVQ